MTQEEQARNMIRAIYEDGEAEINGRVYRFTKMTHKQRRKVFAFYTSVSGDVARNDFSFLDSDRFGAVEDVINKSVTYNDSLLSVLGDAHWEKYPDDYLQFIPTALGVISYPFLAGADTGSRSE